MNADTEADIEADAAVARGCDLSEAGDHVAAAACFARAVELGAEWVNFNLGYELAAMGRYEAAVIAYRRALEVGESDAWLNLGQCLQRLGDLGGALHAYGRGADSGDVHAGVERAMLLRETGEQDSAERVLAELVAGGSPLAEAIAACWEWDRTLDTLLEPQLRAGAELWPATRVGLADLLRATDRVDEAVVVLRRGLALGESESALPLGNIYRDVLHDLDNAEAAYRAGIAAGDTHSHHDLARLLEDLGRVTEARDEYRRGAILGDDLSTKALYRLDATRSTTSASR